MKGSRTFGHLLLCHLVCQLFSDRDVLGHAEFQGFVELQDSSMRHDWNKQHTHTCTQRKGICEHSRPLLRCVPQLQEGGTFCPLTRSSTALGNCPCSAKKAAHLSTISGLLVLLRPPTKLCRVSNCCAWKHSSRARDISPACTAGEGGPEEAMVDTIVRVCPLFHQPCGTG